MATSEITFYFPRWLFPANLGDSVMATFIPKVLWYLGYQVHVVTDKEFCDVFKQIPNVISVRTPFINELQDHFTWKYFAFERKKFCVYPEWHPNVWKEWNSKFDYYYKHPTINLITLNYCMQLGLPLDLPDEAYLPILPTLQVEKINAIGIVPDTKLAGRMMPHPGCDGIGFRFNGAKGSTSWKDLVSYIKTNSDVEIYEFSREYMGLGDKHVSKLPILDLAKLVDSLKLGVLSDGGMHHVFNSKKVPVVLLGAQKVNKPYFFKLSNGIFDESLHAKCLNQCSETIRTLNGWTDLDACCNLQCETVDPIELGKLVVKSLC